MMDVRNLLSKPNGELFDELLQPSACFPSATNLKMMFASSEWNLLESLLSDS